jgi:hypothetical protein
MPVNTTHGPQEAPRGTRESTGHTINTSRVVAEDLHYLDEEPEILAVLPGGDWCAVVDGDAIPLVAWVALDDASMHGVALDEGGRVNLSNNVETRPHFSGYKQNNHQR